MRELEFGLEKLSVAVPHYKKTWLNRQSGTGNHLIGIIMVLSIGFVIDVVILAIFGQ
jgi:hypothetical protein